LIQQDPNDTQDFQESRVPTAYGLDLAGYGTGRSSLCRAEIRSPDLISVEILEGSIFSRAFATGALLDEIVQEEVAVLRQLLREGTLYVDVPIDLQGLPCPRDARYVWQLVRRPVDEAFRGLAPLADSIGWIVARFRWSLERLSETEGHVLGSRVFETYPAASLNLIGERFRGYRGRCQFDGKCWRADTSSIAGAASAQRAKCLAEIANELNISPAGSPSSLSGYEISHDDLDAIICAVTGIAAPSGRLEGVSLADRLSNCLGERYSDFVATPPTGYVLLKEHPNRRIELSRRKFPYLPPA
jgi:Protein of unknown function (DUF429)